MKSLNIKVLAVLVPVLALAGYLGYANLIKEIKSPEDAAAPVQNQKVSYKCEAGKNAFELLEANNQVDAQDSSFGKFITSINGQTMGGGKYWLYSAEGKDATVSASSYICQNNEEILWELK